MDIPEIKEPCCQVVADEQDIAIEDSYLYVLGMLWMCTVATYINITI